MSRKISAFKKIIFTAISVLLFFVAAELILSCLFYFREGKVSFLLKKVVPRANPAGKNENTVYEIPWDFEKDKMRPGTYVTEKGITYSVNKLGFRGKEFDPYNKTKYRIICFGGSSTLGAESPEDSTYPAILERLLLEAGIDAEVLNFGQGSKSLSYIEKILFREAISYKPDLITIYSNRNTALYDSSSPYYETRDIIRTRLQYKIFTAQYFLSENIMTFTALFLLYRKFFMERHCEGAMIGKLKINEFFFTTEYVKKLGTIIAAGNVNNFHCGLIKQPLYLNPPLQMEVKDYPVNKLLLMAKDNSNDAYVSKAYPDDNNMTKFWILTSAALNTQLDAVKRGHPEVIVIDPMEEFLGSNASHQGNLFYDYVHLTPDGNKLLAALIFDAIKPVILNDLKTGKRK